MLPSRFRRKFLVEFTVEESDLLDRLGRDHGSRRAAILTGLKLLAGGELDALRQRVATLEHDLAGARTQHERDAAALTAATTAADQGKTSATTLKTEQAAHKKTTADLEAVTTQLKEANDRLTSVQADYQRLIDELPAQAYCSSCRRLVPLDELALESTDQVDYLYHGSDGFRLTESVVRGRATVLFSRPVSGKPTQPEAAR